MKSTVNNSQKVKKIVIIGLFTALAFVVSVILPIKISFLTLDFKDAVSTICGMFFGPLSGLICAIIVPFIEVTYSGTGVYGLIMNILSSVTMVGISSIIYKYKKTLFGAVIGLVAAVFAVTAVMMAANLLITPYYMNMPTASVAALIPKLLLPFNLTKAIFNAAVTLVLYKPLTAVMRKTDFFGKKKAEVSVELTPEEKKKSKIRAAILLSVGLIIAVVAILVILLLWGGKLSFFDAFKN